MKTLLLTAVAAVAMGAAAQASPFTGFSAGVDLGHAFGQANQSKFGNIGGPFIFTQGDAAISGWTYGVHGSYGYDTGTGFIVGGELALGFNDARGDDKGVGGDKNEVSAQYDAALLGTAGIMVSPTSLLYLQAGWSYLQADSNVLNAPTESVSQSYNGPTVGAGLAFTVGSKTTMRFAYRYTEYSAERVSHPINVYDIETGPETHAFSVGISYKIMD
jgi:opacity protein-like surface antigen